MCKVFSTKAAQAFKACTLYAYKITKKELYYTYFAVFFCLLIRIYTLFFLNLQNKTQIHIQKLLQNLNLRHYEKKMFTFVANFIAN